MLCPILISVKPESQFEPFLLVLDPALAIDGSCTPSGLGMTDLIAGCGSITVTNFRFSLTHCKTGQKRVRVGLRDTAPISVSVPTKTGQLGCVLRKSLNSFLWLNS